MKSILFIHPFLPYPMESGGHQALFNGIRAVKDDYDISLAFEGLNTPEMQNNIKELKQKIPFITLYPLLHEKPAPPQSPHYSRKEKVYMKIRGCYHSIIDTIKKICGLHDEVSLVIVKHDKPDNTKWWRNSVTPTDKEWINHIYKITHEQHFDIIQIEMPWRISDVFAMPKDSKIIHVHHELGFVRRKLELQSMENDPYNETCKQFCDFNEIAQLNMYDAVITLSPIDTDKLKAKGVSKPIFSSFAVIDSLKDIKPSHGDGKRLTFIGPNSHNPNLVGITWFLDNCWEKLKSKDDSYTLDIIGKWDEKTKTEYSKKYFGVNFLGFVDELYAAIKDSIMIVPITIGSGIRMKILEAASKGIPFVSTIVGAEGIPVTDGKECFLTDDANEFVEDIIKLQDVSLRNKFANAAFRMVLKIYSIEALRKNRLEIYEQLLNHKVYE